MSSKNDDKKAQKNSDWTNNPNVTMTLKKSNGAGWNPNNKVTHRLKESQDKESK